MHLNARGHVKSQLNNIAYIHLTGACALHCRPARIIKDRSGAACARTHRSHAACDRRAKLRLPFKPDARGARGAIRLKQPRCRVLRSELCRLGMKRLHRRKLRRHRRISRARVRQQA